MALDLDLAYDSVLGPYAKPFGLDKDVVSAMLAELGKHGQGLVIVTLYGELLWARGHYEGANEENTTGNHL